MVLLLAGILLTDSSGSLANVIPVINGQLLASVAWSIDSAGNSMAPPLKQRNNQLNRLAISVLHK